MLFRILLIFFCLTLQLHSYAQSNTRVAIKKVVIDPGHGGKDPGAVSINKRHREKDITLSVSLMLGKLIKESYPDVEIIYTRSADIFIPLDKRSDIANKEKADLFISIHVNSARARAASGTETFVMGLDKSSSNLEVSKLEKSLVILATISGGAPMLGFLGTVTGMVLVFFNMTQNQTGVVQLTDLSSGMYQAMVTTVGGLIVGILAYFGYNYLISRVDSVVRNLESKTLEFMDLLNEPSK